MELRQLESGIWLAEAALAGRTGHAAGRALLERLYFHVTGEAMPPVVVAEGGKPHFSGSPWHFSITHTPRRAFCALAPFPVGIDAEETDRVINLRLAEKSLSPGERAQFDSAMDKRMALLTFWVLKEAEAKRTGLGLRGYPNGTDFSLADPRVTRWKDCLLAVTFNQN